MFLKRKSFKVFFLSLTGFVLLTLTLIGLQPLPDATLENCEKHTGIVLEVLPGGGTGDIIIRVKDDKNYYYINRGIESGLSMAVLKDKLENKKVEILTIKHWTPLDPVSISKHIAHVYSDGLVLYSEL